MTEFVKTASRFIKACGIKADTTFFEQRLKSHPDYPALTSLTDTLDELGITYSAMLVDKERVQDISFPALFHLEKNGRGDFDIIYSAADLKTRELAILPFWDGVTLGIAPDSKINNTAHEAVTKQKRKLMLWQSVFIACFISIAVISSAIHFSVWLSAISLLSLLGTVVCSLIIMHSMGKSTQLVNQICSSNMQNGCDKVLQSNAGQAFGKNISLGDIGLAYFSGILLYSVAMAAFNQADAALTLLVLPAVLSIPVVSWSLYYQKKIVKAWCRMCLLVAAILLLQAVVIAIGNTSFTFNWNNTSPNVLIAAAVCFLFPASWFLVAPLLRKASEADAFAGDIMKWKRDPEIFLLNLQRGEALPQVKLRGDIVLGNAEAPLQLLIISNPFCNPCAEAHKELEKLIAAHTQEVALTVRFLFSVAPGMEDDGRKEVVALIMEACRQDSLTGRSIHIHPVDAWYREMNIEKFRERYKLPIKPDIDEEILKQQEEWCIEQNFAFTPTIYANGYLLPRHKYAISDIAGLLPSLTDLLTVTSQQQHPAFINH